MLNKWILEAGDLNLTLMDLEKGVVLFENFSSLVKIEIKKIDYNNYTVKHIKNEATESTSVNITDLRKAFSGFNWKIIKRLSLAYTDEEYSKDHKRFKEQVAERDRQLKEQGG
jgi:hypothetical protein